MIYDIDEYTFQDGQYNAPIRTFAKQKFGEVMTPYIIVERLLDTFPRSVWSKPDQTWIDPCCGSGQFIAGVYFRLMHGLSAIFPRKRIRHQHIIRRMLFMQDLLSENVRHCRKLFGVDANIRKGDFLLLDNESEATALFDNIVGNPPFQADVIGNGGKNKLYQRIVIHSLSHLAGRIAFICPINLFGGAGAITGQDNAYTQLLTECHISNVCFSDEIKEQFEGIQQPMCYFLGQKKKVNNTQIKTKDTCIEQANGRTFIVRLDPFRAVNPVGNWTPRTEILAKKWIGARNTSVYIRGRPLSEYNTSRGKYTLFYTPTKQLFTGKVDLARGIGVKKVIIYGVGSGDPVIDIDMRGEFGVGPNVFYFPFTTRAQGQIILAQLNSPEFKELAAAVRTQRQFIKTAFIEHIALFDKILA